MPLVQKSLEATILVALQNMKENAKKEVAEKSSNEDTILADFAKELSQAIHDYILTATVTTTVNTGVTGIASPVITSTGAGAGPVVGKGTGAGSGNLS